MSKELKQYKLPEVKRRVFASVDGDNWVLINNNQVEIRCTGKTYSPIIRTNTGHIFYSKRTYDDLKNAADSIQYFETQSPFKVFKEKP